jgi:transcriptional regulator with XRE-family HTH domain
MEDSVPHLVDVHVGQRLRERRQMMGATQEQVADQVGVRFQQVQKYETAENRISASRLWEIARVLDVPITHFFEGLAGDRRDMNRAPRPVPVGEDARALVRAYFTIPRTQRRQLLNLARSLGDAAPGSQ